MPAENKTLSLKNTTMDYIRFGRGERTLIILPGLGDGLRTVKGTALPMSLMYRKLATHFTVYAFSRVNNLPANYSTREMALDQLEAMRLLGIQKASVLGVSMGGMIAQHLAVEAAARINFEAAETPKTAATAQTAVSAQTAADGIENPLIIDRLVLTVTAAEPHPEMQESINEWMRLARQGDHAGFIDSNMKRTYTERYYRHNKWTSPLVGALTKPKSYDRFLTQAQACLEHNSLNGLASIQCPTLVIGGAKDQALAPDQSRKIADALPNATLRMYENYGHALYEEASDFEEIVLNFLLQG